MLRHRGTGEWFWAIYLQAEMIKCSETESRENQAVAGDGGQACEKRG